MMNVLMCQRVNALVAGAVILACTIECSGLEDTTAQAHRSSAPRLARRRENTDVSD